MKQQFRLLLLLTVVIFCSCTPGVEDDIAAAKELDTGIRQEALVHDAEIVNYIYGLGKKLAKAIPAENQIPEFVYKFRVVNVKGDQTFTYGGGYIYVFRESIQITSKNEGELAGIIAHEIAHCVLRHVTQTGADDEQNRANELEADALAVKILVNAGYNPEDFANFFTRLARDFNRKGYVSGPTHPSLWKRAKQVRAIANTLVINKKPIRNTNAFKKVQKRLTNLPWYA